MRGPLLAMLMAASFVSIPASGEPWSGLFEERRALADLGAVDATLRAEAATWLGRWGRREVVSPQLIERLMTEREPQAAGAMVAALGRLDAVSAVPALVELAPHASFEVQKTILRILGGLGGADAQRALIEALHDPKLGPLASDALVRIGPTAIPLLLQSLGERSSPLAARSLGRIGSPLATTGLMRALERASPGLAAATLEALAEIGDARARAAARARIDDPSLGTRVAALRALATLGDESDVGRLETIAREARGATRIAALTGLLALAPERALAPLQVALLEEAAGRHDELRARALSTPSPALIPLFAGLIEGERAFFEAALALGRLEEGAGLEALISCAASGGVRGSACRLALAGALRGSSGNPRASHREVGLAAIRDVEPRSERRLLLALARDPEVASELRAALHSADAPERASAARAAELLGDPRLRAPVAEALRAERDPEAFRRLATAAATLDAPYPIARLAEPASSAATAPEAMLLAAHLLAGAEPRIQRLAREIFRRGLRSPEGRVRAGAARALAISGDRQAYRALLETTEDEEAAVRRAGARALELLAVPAARAPLLARARIESDPGVYSALLDAARAPERRRLTRFAAAAPRIDRRFISAEAGSEGPMTIDVILDDGRWLRLAAERDGEPWLWQRTSEEAPAATEAHPTSPDLRPSG